MKNSGTIKPALMDSQTACRFCGCGLTLWRQLVTTGRTPEPIRLNSKALWSTHQLELWSLHNCPSRDSAEWRKILEYERNGKE
ncbi:MAG: hypothetical protein ACYS3N_09425 [Planctomycetota bacterium]